jgi:hypothetical protein
VGDLVAIADERFTDEEIRGHTCLHSGFASEKREELAKHIALDEAKVVRHRSDVERSHAVPRTGG